MSSGAFRPRWYARNWLRWQATNLRARLQYPASFSTEVFVAFVGNFTGFVAIWILTERFGTIGGWTLGEMAFLYGLCTASFGAAQLLFCGFEQVPKMIRQGEFDRVLTRPWSPFFHVLASVLKTQRLGRMFEGAVILVAGMTMVPTRWGVWQLAVLLGALALGVLFYGAILIVTASQCFWVGSPEQGPTTVMAYASTHLGRYPTEIFHGALRGVLTFVLPVALVHYLPATLLLGRDNMFGFGVGPSLVLPFSALIVFALAVLFWRSSVARYQSAGG